MSLPARLSATILVAAILSALATADNVEGGLPASSRFQKITLALQKSETEMASEFATTALTILTEIYIAEVDLARNEAKGNDDSGKLIAWADAVEQYAGQLSLMLKDIDTGFPVTISPTETAFAGIAVAVRFVILNHPRADQQSAFEHRVLGDFCGRENCEKLIPSVESPIPIPVSAPVVSPIWSFTGDGPVCSSGGITIQFPSTRNLASLRSICTQFFQELSALATEIIWQTRHDVTVDWEEIDIQATPKRPEHMVILNPAGDVTLLSLPLLHSSETLLLVVTPWLQAKTLGTVEKKLSIDAASYGWTTSAEEGSRNEN